MDYFRNREVRNKTVLVQQSASVRSFPLSSLILLIQQSASATFSHLQKSASAISFCHLANCLWCIFSHLASCFDYTISPLGCSSFRNLLLHIFSFHNLLLLQTSSFRNLHLLHLFHLQKSASDAYLIHSQYVFSTSLLL